MGLGIDARTLLPVSCLIVSGKKVGQAGRKTRGKKAASDITPNMFVFDVATIIFLPRGSM